jgi:glycosyltransferase involved in cell wall biosynthesis
MISVITPVYNGASFIEETALSVLQQDDTELEYLIVNDGSFDTTADVLAELQVRFPHQLRVIHQNNQGEAAAINHGLKEAKGDFVCIVSADDPLLPQHLKTVSEALERNPRAVVAYPDWEMIDQNGRPLRTITTLPFDLRTLVSDFVCLPGPGAMIRRSEIMPKGLRNARFRFVSDYDAWLHLSLRGPFIRVPSVLARYRIHPDQATTTGRGREMAIEIESVIREFFEERDLPAQLRRLKRRAIAFSSYYAGLQKLHHGDVPGRRRMLKSLLLAPPFPVRRKTHRRHPLAIIAVLAYPIPSIIQRRLFQRQP